MQVDLFDSGPVHFRLDAGDRRERRIGLFLHVPGCIGFLHDLPDVAQVATMRLRRDVEIDLGTGDLAPDNAVHPHSYPIESESIGEGAEPIRLETHADQRTQGHVAGDTAEGVEDCDSHRP